MASGGGARAVALLFIASWTPRSISDYWVIYDAYPAPGPPGTTGSASFHLIAPFETGTYYLWFCLSSSGVIGSNLLETEYLSELGSPGHILLMVTGAPMTVTVTSKVASAFSSPFSVPLVPVGVGGIAVAVIGSVVVLERKRGRLRIGRRHVTPSINLAKVVQQKPTLSTGYAELDGTLGGGIPEGYAVILVSPSYDERDLLLRRIVDSSISSGRPTFYISSDIERTQDLLGRYRSGFYAFSPQADKIDPDAANLYKIPYLTENLSEANISLTLAFKQARAKEQATKMTIIIDVLSDLLLRYKAVMTRRWLSDFVGKRKAEGFTTLATLNPLVGTKEDNQMVMDFFDGVIEIFEKELKERARRFLVVKKMYGQKYSESELMLDKDKLF
jgi:KaiC/GvpD/RAD55 family RecA-like ATPase